MLRFASCDPYKQCRSFCVGKCDRDRQGFSTKSNFCQTSKYLTPTQKCLWSTSSFIIWQYIAYIIVTLDFDCSLNMHELIDPGWYIRLPHFYRVVLNLIKSQKKHLVDPIKEIFQMTLLISQNPLMVKLLHKYLSVWLSGGEAPIHRTGWTRIPCLKWR